MNNQKFPPRVWLDTASLDHLREESHFDAPKRVLAFSRKCGAEEPYLSLVEHEAVVVGLKRALEFYADNDNWFREPDPTDTRVIKEFRLIDDDDADSSKINKHYYVGGKRAREALAELEKMVEEK